jgi:hypothetical protein
MAYSSLTGIFAAGLALTARLADDATGGLRVLGRRAGLSALGKGRLDASCDAGAFQGRSC